MWLLVREEMSFIYSFNMIIWLIHTLNEYKSIYIGKKRLKLHNEFTILLNSWKKTVTTYLPTTACKNIFRNFLPQYNEVTNNYNKTNFTSDSLINYSSDPDAPPVLLYSFIEQTLQPGPAVSLKCSAAGNPTPQISWTLDGFPLPTNGR